MLNEPELYSKIVTIIHELSPELSDVATNPETLLIHDLNIDSLKFAELTVLLEQEFSQPIFIPDLLSEVRDPHDLNIQALVDFTKSCLQN